MPPAGRAPQPLGGTGHAPSRGRRGSPVRAPEALPAQQASRPGPAAACGPCALQYPVGPAAGVESCVARAAELTAESNAAATRSGARSASRRRSRDPSCPSSVARQPAPGVRRETPSFRAWEG